MTAAPDTGDRGRAPVWRRLALVVAILAWSACAVILLRTTVPRGLDLPTIDVRATFGGDVVDAARSFERVTILLWIGSEVALLAALWLFAKRGTVFLRESAAGPIGSGMLLGMLGLALAWAVQKPFGLVDLWWSRRHGVSEVAYWEWLVGAPLELAVSFAFICLALLIVMALARFVGEWWWIPGAAVFTTIAFAFVLLAPYLVTTHAPDDRRLVATYDRLATAEGVEDVPLVVEKVSGDTSQANAYAFGILGTRRIVVWDTLLDGRFTDREIAVVLAHELGHQAGRHIDKALAWFGLFALPGAWFVMRLTRRRGGMGSAEAVPLALLGIVCFSLVTGPFQSAVSRRIEADADWRALRTTRDPAAARELFTRFASTSLGDPSPSTWAYLLFEDHPTLAQRVAMANAWERRAATTP